MNTTQTIVKMMMDRWNGSLKNCDTAINSMSDEELQLEVAPNKNRGIYLLGHLIAVHDDMISLLGLGEKLYPELFSIFIESPDKKNDDIPSASDLRMYWKKQYDFLTEKFEAMQPEEWFEKHTRVSEEDFINEPHRNKLNILLTRTTHLSYHTGQIILIK